MTYSCLGERTLLDQKIKITVQTAEGPALDYMIFRSEEYFKTGDSLSVKIVNLHSIALLTRSSHQSST